MLLWHKQVVTYPSNTVLCWVFLSWMDSYRNTDSERPPGAQIFAVKQAAPAWKQIMKWKLGLWDLIISPPCICQEFTFSKYYQPWLLITSPHFWFTNKIYKVGTNTIISLSDKLVLVLIVNKSLTLILFFKRFFYYSVKLDPQNVLEDWGFINIPFQQLT